jgi:hypothetical protein
MGLYMMSRLQLKIAKEAGICYSIPNVFGTGPQQSLTSYILYSNTLNLPN